MLGDSGSIAQGNPDHLQSHVIVKKKKMHNLFSWPIFHNTTLIVVIIKWNALVIEKYILAGDACSMGGM